MLFEHYITEVFRRLALSSGYVIPRPFFLFLWFWIKAITVFIVTSNIVCEHNTTLFNSGLVSALISSIIECVLLEFVCRI